MRLRIFPSPLSARSRSQPANKFRDRQGYAAGSAAPGSVVGIESAFGKRIGVRGRFDAVAEIVDDETYALATLPVITLCCIRVVREHCRPESGDEFDGHREQEGEAPADVARREPAARESRQQFRLRIGSLRRARAGRHALGRMR